jgi:hypothetical protein
MSTTFQCPWSLLSSTILSVLMEIVMQTSEVIAFGPMSIILYIDAIRLT